MRKVFAFLLALSLLFALCACGSKSKTYETAEEYAEAILAKKQDAIDHGKGFQFIENFEEEFKADTANHHFFSEEEQDNRLWEKLYQNAEGNHEKSNLSLSEIYSLYAIANGTDYWFDRLNISGNPLGSYGSGSPYYSGIFSRERIVNGIKNEFKDPKSVEIIDTIFLFSPVLDDVENTGAFDSPLEGLLVVNVRATNSYGAYVTQGFLLKMRGSSFKILTDCNYDSGTGADYSLKLSDSFYGFRVTPTRLSD